MTVAQAIRTILKQDQVTAREMGQTRMGDTLLRGANLAYVFARKQTEMDHHLKGIRESVAKQVSGKNEEIMVLRQETDEYIYMNDSINFINANMYFSYPPASLHAYSGYQNSILVDMRTIRP